MKNKLDEQLRGLQHAMNRREASRVEKTARQAGVPDCNVYRQNDEIVCRTCGLRWETREEQPPCPRS